MKLFIVQKEVAEIEWKQTKDFLLSLSQSQNHRTLNYKFSLSLFRSFKEQLYFLIILLFIFIFSMSKKYIEYLEFSHFSTYDGEFIVIDQYTKEPFTIFKFKSTKNSLLFYSSSRYKYKNLLGMKTNLSININENLKFLDFLNEPFLIISKIELNECNRDSRFKLYLDLKDIHKNEKIADLYSALFFATPIRGELREDLNRLGLNPVATLSGFHVSLIILFSIIIFLIFYSPFHKRFFPYRNKIRDSIFFGIIIIIIYNLFLDSPPPFLRSVFMFIITFILFDRNINKNNFETLLIGVLIMLAFDPTLFFSMSFWFSVSGIFYILLYMKLFKFGLILDVILLNFFVFFAMLPIVHLYFEDFYLIQLLSPIWNILFSFIYPIMILIHILNIGEIFDQILLYFLSMNFWEHYKFNTSNTFLIIYLMISIFIALFNKNYSSKLSSIISFELFKKNESK